MCDRRRLPAFRRVDGDSTRPAVDREDSAAFRAVLDREPTASRPWRSARIEEPETGNATRALAAEALSSPRPAPTTHSTAKHAHTQRRKEPIAAPGLVIARIARLEPEATDSLNGWAKLDHKPTRRATPDE